MSDDNKKFEWEGSYGSTHFRVSGSTDNDYVKGLVTHGQETIAAAQEKGDAGEEEDGSGLQGFVRMLQSAGGAAIPIMRMGGPGGPDGEESECPHERVMDIIMTLGRNDWKIDIETDEEEECWVVTAEHPEHGLTTTKDEHLFDALAATGEQLRHYVQQADA